MRKLFILFFVFIFVSLSNSQTRTINLDSQSNALLLTPSNSKMVNNLTPGQPYNITVSAHNISGTPMQGAFIVMQDTSGEVDARYAPSGNSFEFVPINNSYQFAAFYVDWSTTSDNSGTVTIDINGPTNQTLTIDVKNDAILLDNVTSIVGGLDPNQEYVVSVRDSALSGVLIRGCYFMYEDASGIGYFKYIPSGQAFTFKPSTFTSYQLAPLYVDWSTTSDNSGKIIVDIKPRGNIIQTINLDSQSNALLLTPSNSKMVNNLTPGQPYNITVSAHNISGTPMQGAFIVMQDTSGEVDARYAPSGNSFEFVPINNSYQFAAFYVDWSTTSDNSGTVTIDINGPTNQTLTIDVKNDAILLDNVTSIVGGLDPNQEYVVSVRDSALSGVLIRGCYFMYEDASGIGYFKYIPSGQAFTFKPSTFTSYQLAPLYVDWSTTSDNSGKIIVDISKTTLTDVNSRQEIVNKWLLFQNYPNPFNPITAIKYNIPNESFVTIKVFDVLGEEITTLVNERKSAGNYSINFNGSNLPSGIYFYRMQAIPISRPAESFVSTKKFVLLK